MQKNGSYYTNTTTFGYYDNAGGRGGKDEGNTFHVNEENYKLQDNTDAGYRWDAKYKYTVSEVRKNVE